MGKAQNWYLRGWEFEDQLNDRGSHRRVLVYRGEYYSFQLSPQRLKTLKIQFLCLIAALFAIYLIGFFLNASGFLFALTGAPYGLTIIPMIYLCLGVFSLMRAENTMTYRDYFGGVKRTRWSAVISLVFLTVSTAGQIIFLLLYKVADVSNLWFLVVCVLCAAVLTIILLLLKRYPAKLLPQK